jgi:O-acetyl-ADP-ribose deacetylase (regulator of RNase III)
LAGKSTAETVKILIKQGGSMEGNKFSGKKCFAIMPFGKKKEKRPDGTEVEIDFDHVYHELIKKAVEAIGVECDRCDEIIDTGSIHAKMFNSIFDADVAIVDVSFMNPNVYYELGVRHALKKNITLVIRKNSNQPPPFNISGLNVLGYDIDDEDQLNASRKTIGNYVKNGLEKQSVDSLIYEYLDNLKVERKPKRIGKKDIYLYKIAKAAGKEIGMITGDIQNIKEIDVWVNSENTNMEMARHFDRSISATIRYRGAKKDRAGRVTDDLIAKELREAAGTGDVPPACVIPTGTGELLKLNNVKKIFHAAAVVGQVGQGYGPINNISDCVRNSLELADSEEMAGENIQSILFPLMGTGTTRLEAEQVAGQLFDAAISYVEENPETKLQKIYFLAHNEDDLELCLHFFEHDPRISHPKV